MRAIDETPRACPRTQTETAPADETTLSSSDLAGRDQSFSAGDSLQPLWTEWQDLHEVASFF